MHDASVVGCIDGGMVARWGRSADDYSAFRPDPPRSMFDRLVAFGVGLPGQCVLDLGTGTGALAFGLADRGAHVVGTDVDPGQIEAARERAHALEAGIRFEAGPAEQIAEPAGTFDLVTANQCWPYFDRNEAVREIRRVLRPNGRLVVSSFTYLPRLSLIATLSEEIVLKHSSGWTGANWDGHVPVHPKWLPEVGSLEGMFAYDEDVPFTRESWRGRMRALRAIGPTLSEAAVEVFDREHAEALEKAAPPQFAIPHRIVAHIIRAN